MCCSQWSLIPLCARPSSEPVNTCSDVHRSLPPLFKYFKRSINKKTNICIFISLARDVLFHQRHQQGHYKGSSIRSGPFVDCDFIFENQSDFSQMPSILQMTLKRPDITCVFLKITLKAELFRDVQIRLPVLLTQHIPTFKPSVLVGIVLATLSYSQYC